MGGNRKMQELSINLKALWERPPKPQFRATDAEDLPPLIGKGYLAFYRRFDQTQASEDFPRDRMQRICINFAGVDDAKINGDVADFYTLAGVSLFGESTGNPLMPITYARYGVVNYRNTGCARIEAGDDVYFLFPTDANTQAYAASTTLTEWGDARVAITVPSDTFKTYAAAATGGPVDPLLAGRYFVGRSLLAADPGMVGTLFMSG